MNPYNQVVLEMTEAALERTSRPEVEQLATAIYTSREIEIEAMQDLLERRGASLEVPSTPDGGSQGGQEGQHDG